MTPSSTHPLLVPLPYREDTTYYVERILDLPNCIFFDSGYPAPTNSLPRKTDRFDIFSSSPSHTLNLNCGKLTRHTSNTNHSVTIEIGDEGLLAYLNHELAEQLNQLVKTNIDLPFYGGYAGYFGYDLYRYWESSKSPRTTPRQQEDQKIPDLSLGFYLWSGVIDHEQKKAWLSFLPQCPAELIDTIKSHLMQSDHKIYVKKFSLINKLKSNIDVNSYIDSFAKIRAYILAGDCYQVNFAQQFSAQYMGSPWSAYRHLRKTISAPFGCYFEPIFCENSSKTAILSFSPERFIKLKNRQVLAQPIKGTMPRHHDEQEDNKNADILKSSEKNRAENLMIVDLLRNDLGKCCEYGSIKTEKLFELQSFSNVHHLVSSISGTLKSMLTAFDLLQAALPGGSITGAPKSRAVEIINELESHQRSIYCGAIGYINLNGDMDTNIAIRTLLCQSDNGDTGTIYCWSGGGIVADSVWEQEYQESYDKVGALLRGLETI